MRRSDREVVDSAEILTILRRCDVCRLALNAGGYPYIIPLNFGVEADGETVRLYFHSAVDGYKVGLMQADPRASFEADCGHELQYFEEKGYCTFAYESVTGRGRIEILPEERKQHALELIMEHYHPGQNAYFNPAAIPRTLVYMLTVERMTAKRKAPK